MHTKNFNGIEIKYSGPDLHQYEILSVMDFLIQQIEKIDSYPDKSLFFQNPQIIEKWLQLVRTISKLEAWDISEDNTEWEERTETYVTYLLTLRNYFLEYHKLYSAYFGRLKDIIEVYGSCLEESCISKELIKVLLVEKELLDLKDVNQYLTELNRDSSDTRYSVFKTLSKLFDFLSAIMDSGLVKLMELKPSIDDFTKAIDYDLKEWTLSFGKLIFDDMKEDLTRHYKAYRTAPYTPELWGELLSADEDALLMASKQQFTNCDAIKQEHWGEDMKKQMDENGELMHLIYTSCRTDKLFDIEKAESSYEFIALLTPYNLQIFYDIIVRRNLIQSEMFPELKTQHEEWLNRVNKQPEENTPEEELHNLKDKLNYNAPKIHLQRLLQQSWFAELRTDEKYNSQWTDSFIKDLMTSEYGKGIARDWAVTGARDKKNQLKAYIVGLLKDEGVLKGRSYVEIGNMTGLNNEERTFSTNMSRGKKQPYAEWVKEYVAK